MQNKFAAITMIMIAMIGMTGFAAATQEAADVTVSIGDGTGDVTIPIMVENVTNLGSVDLRLDFDPAVVEVSLVTDGDLNLTVHTIHTGWIRVGGVTTGTTAVSGDVIVANVTFATIDPCSNATSDLTITVTTLTDATPGGNSVPRNVDNGVYTSAFDGDVSGDGYLDMHDAMYLARAVIGQEGYVIQCPNIADVNSDGNVTMADAHYLANHVIETPDYEDMPYVT